MSLTAFCGSNAERKMGAYKNCSSKTNERPTILCPCPAPKRLLTSTNWSCRNDSSNVNAILHPLASPRLKYGEKTKGDVIEKHILSRNTCYCKYTKNKHLPKPSFFKRPSTCVSYGGGSKKSGTYEDNLKRTSLIDECVCEEVEDDGNIPEDSTSRVTRLKLSKSAPGSRPGLQFSDQRKLYGEYREAQEEIYQADVQRYRDFEKESIHQSGVGAGDSAPDINTILGTQDYGASESSGSSPDFKYGTTTSTVAGHNASDYHSLEDEFPEYSEQTVPDFRRRHYFETHNVGRIVEITGDVSKDHICIHQFKLDRRWLPEPVSKDSFGRSLCKICDRPMEGSRLNLGSSGHVFSEDGSVSKSKLRNYAEAYRSGLMPRHIDLSDKKSKIELVIKESDIACFYSDVNRTKHPVYCNSLALRQQRMRLI